MKVAVLIISYNFERWLTRCLDSLRHSTLRPEVYVVDNASTDQSVTRIRHHYPEVHLTCSTENLGFGRANNLAAQQALADGADFLCLLNQDAWVDYNTLETLCSFSTVLPKYGILSPTHLNGAGDRLEKGFASYTQKNTLEVSTSQEPLIEAPFINAACWLVPAVVWRKVGGFCPLFYHYGEDVDFVNRLHYHGYRVGWSPCVTACHDRDQRPQTHAAFLHSEWVWLLAEYANINRSLPSAFAYSVLAALKKAMKATVHAQIKDACAFIGMSMKLLAQSRALFAYRKNNKTGNCEYQ